MELSQFMAVGNCGIAAYNIGTILAHKAWGAFWREKGAAFWLVIGHTIGSILYALWVFRVLG